MQDCFGAVNLLVAVDRLVSRLVDRPVYRLVSRLVDRPVYRLVGRLVDRLVYRSVDRSVIKPTWNCRFVILNRSNEVITKLHTNSRLYSHNRSRSRTGHCIDGWTGEWVMYVRSHIEYEYDDVW